MPSSMTYGRGAQLGRPRPWNTIFGVGDREGLNERGEAPPPYIHEDKPPSISAGEGPSRVRITEVDGENAVELRQIDPAARRPPGYEENFEPENATAGPRVNTSAEGTEGSVRRPDAAVTARSRSE